MHELTAAINIMMLGGGLQGQGESSRGHSNGLNSVSDWSLGHIEKLKEVTRLVELLENDFSAKKISSAG